MKAGVISFPLGEVESRLDLAFQTISKVGLSLLQAQEDHFLRRADASKEDVQKLAALCRDAEENFYERIKKKFTNDNFVAYSPKSDQDSDFQWWFSPLDGRRNFSHGLPHFCSLAAICFRSKPVGSLVYLPSSQTSYHALYSAGAFKDQRRIRVSNISELEYALTASGLPQESQRRTALTEILANISAFISSGTGLRRSGSAVLDICWIAEGLYDAFWERNFQPHNFCAASLILQEAGGRLSDFRGKHPGFPQGIESSFDVLASNGSLHERLLQLFVQVSDLEGIN